MMAYLKLFWIFIKAQFCRIFFRRLNVSFKKVYGDWYCDIKGWTEKFFLNSLMVGDVRLTQVWLCPVTLFEPGRYPQYIYFKSIDNKK